MSAPAPKKRILIRDNTDYHGSDLAWSDVTIAAAQTSVEASTNTLSHHTARAYAGAVRKFIDHLAASGITAADPVEAITVEHFISFPAYLVASGVSKASMAVQLAGAVQFLNWLVIAGALQPTYEDQLRLKTAAAEATKRHRSRLPHVPRESDVEKMRAAARTLDIPSPVRERNRAIIELLHSSGCRNEEICQLTVSDVDLSERQILVNGKGDKDRLVWFSSDAAVAIRTYWRARRDRRPEAPLFASHSRRCPAGQPVSTETVRDVVRAVAQRAGVTQITPHKFRHAFGTRMLEATGDLALVQDLLGHADPATTRTYARLTADRLKRAHREVFG